MGRQRRHLQRESLSIESTWKFVRIINRFIPNCFTARKIVFWKIFLFLFLFYFEMLSRAAPGSQITAKVKQPIMTTKPEQKANLLTLPNTFFLFLFYSIFSTEWISSSCFVSYFFFLAHFMTFHNFYFYHLEKKLILCTTKLDKRRVCE